MEYPRHDGDIAIDLDGPQDFEPVAWVEPPDFNPDTQIREEGLPELIESQWRMTWIVRPLTDAEAAARQAYKQSLKDKFGIDLDAPRP